MSCSSRWSTLRSPAPSPTPASPRACGTRWLGQALSPRTLTKIHPRFQTPVNAVASLCCITLAVALVMGVVLGAFNQFVFYGIGLTFSLVFVYSAANLGVFRFY